MNESTVSLGNQQQYDFAKELLQGSGTCPLDVQFYPDELKILIRHSIVERLFARLSSSSTAVLPYCGHNTYEYRPEEYIRIVLDFLGRHENSTGLSSSEREEFNYSCLAVKKT